MSLYQITSEMQSILDAVLDGGIDSPEVQEALNEHLTGLDVALDTKAESRKLLASVRSRRLMMPLPRASRKD